MFKELFKEEDWRFKMPLTINSDLCYSLLYIHMPCVNNASEERKSVLCDARCNRDSTCGIVRGSLF